MKRKKYDEEEVLANTADFFKIFSDSTRIRILYALLEKEFSVSGIVERVGASQSAVSHQLRILRNTHLVKTKKEGKEVFYSLDDEHIASILKQGMEHVVE